jgi:hypothetical protein
MPRDYRVFVNFECLEALPRFGKRREAVIHFFKVLGSVAHLGGDFQIKDPVSSRRFEVTYVSGFAVTWWIDGPVNEVKIGDVCRIAK